MALDHLSKDEIVHLDEERKAAMVSKFAGRALQRWASLLCHPAAASSHRELDPQLLPHHLAYLGLHDP